MADLTAGDAVVLRDGISWEDTTPGRVYVVSQVDGSGFEFLDDVGDLNWGTAAEFQPVVLHPAVADKALEYFREKLTRGPGARPGASDAADAESVALASMAHEVYDLRVSFEPPLVPEA